MTLTPGNFLVVAHMLGTGGGKAGISVSGFGLTFTPRFQQVRPGDNLTLTIWTAPITSPSPNPDTVDVTWTNPAQGLLIVQEVAGAVFGQLVSRAGQGGNASVGITTAQNDSMVLGILAKRGSDAIIGDADYTERENAATSAGAFSDRVSGQTQDRIFAIAGSDIVEWSGSWNSFADWSAVAIELRE